jgi:hypothetical protein
MAHPAAEDARQHSRDLYAQGQDAFNAGNFLGALDAYEASYATAHEAQLPTAPVVLLAIASANERLNHYDEAISSLHQYLTERPDAADRSDVEARIARDQHGGGASSSMSSARSASSAAPSSASTWTRTIGTGRAATRLPVDPDSAAHLAPELASHLAAAGPNHYDHDRVSVFQVAAGIRPDRQYGGTTRAALIFWGVSNPPRAFANPGGTYSAPRSSDGTQHPPIPGSPMPTPPAPSTSAADLPLAPHPSSTSPASSSSSTIEPLPPPSASSSSSAAPIEPLPPHPPASSPSTSSAADLPLAPHPSSSSSSSSSEGTPLEDADEHDQSSMRTLEPPPLGSVNATQARSRASGAARAIRDRSSGWETSLHNFQTAAGLEAGPYDGRTYNALVFYGIRQPPPETSSPAHGAPEAVYQPRSTR